MDSVVVWGFFFEVIGHMYCLDELCVGFSVDTLSHHWCIFAFFSYQTSIVHAQVTLYLFSALFLSHKHQSAQTASIKQTTLKAQL
jgi:hypothetical protein